MFLGMEDIINDGRYELIRQIGGGGCGIVWSAKKKDTDTKVAIKRIPNLFRELDTVKRTLREIQLLRHFDHENIVRILDIIEPSSSEDFNELYIVYELMDGDLHKLIRSAQRLGNQVIQLLVYQILRGLKYIHSAGVLHRDLKPTNILVNRKCDLKICDFGCGRVGDVQAGRAGLKMTLLEHVQTRWYCAPEGLMSSSQYSTAVDVWSVGCILAELFGRNVLFQGRTNKEQLKRILGILGKPAEEEIAKIQNEEYRRKIQKQPQVPKKDLQQLFKDAPSQAIDLLDKMLQFDPAKRITVVEALRHPYFGELHDENDEPVANCKLNEAVFDSSLELTASSLRELMYEEIVVHYASLHPKQAAHPIPSTNEVPMIRSDEAESPPGSGELSTQLVAD